MSEPWGRPSVKVLEGPIESLTRTLAVRYLKQEDSHSVKRRGSPIFVIFIRNPVRHARSYTHLMLKKVAMMRRRWVDGNPSEMN